MVECLVTMIDDDHNDLVSIVLWLDCGVDVEYADDILENAYLDEKKTIHFENIQLSTETNWNQARVAWPDGDRVYDFNFFVDDFDDTND